MLILAAAIGLAAFSPAPGGLATPRPALAAAKAKGKAAKRPARAKRAAKPGAVPSPELADDAGQPLPVVWKRQVDRFLAASRPVYGAFVAMDPVTGKLLAVSEYSSDAAHVPHPATTAAFPAASVFKVVTASALLADGTKPGTTTCYHGGSGGLDMQHIKDSKRDRACMSLAAAFAHSTNAVFGKLAVRRLDPDRLLAQAEKLLFNRKIAVEGLETESRATRAPDDLSLARMAAGFVNTTLSPLHAAVMAAIIAGGGLVPESVTVLNGNGKSKPVASASAATSASAAAPSPAQGTAGSAGTAGTASSPPAREPVLDARTLEELKAMMVRTSTEGTGRKHFAALAPRLGGPVAVKSGTLTSRNGSGLFNTWMVGFFPANRPEVAFAAVIATRGPAPVKAGNLSRYAIDAFLKLKRARAGQS
jgi:cell division protein FtsI/penicillin-binding protein 2